ECVRSLRPEVTTHDAGITHWQVRYTGIVRRDFGAQAADALWVRDSRDAAAVGVARPEIIPNPRRSRRLVRRPPTRTRPPALILHPPSSNFPPPITSLRTVAARGS